MANYCLNKIRILKTKGKGLEEIMDRFKGSEFQFNTDELSTSYAFDVVRSKVNEVYFYTRWTPPLYYVQQLSELYPDAIFDLMYSETGLLVFGHEKYSKGFCYYENDNLNCEYSLTKKGYSITRAFNNRLYNNYYKYRGGDVYEDIRPTFLEKIVADAIKINMSKEEE